MVHEHDWKGSVNYEPNHDREGFMENKQYLYSTRNSCGQYRQESIPKTLNFRQAGMLYRRFSTVDRDNLVRNIAADLGQVTNMKIRNTMCAHFYKADLTFGGSVAGTVECDMMQVKLIAADLQE